MDVPIPLLPPPEPEPSPPPPEPTPEPYKEPTPSPPPSPPDPESLDSAQNNPEPKPPLPVHRNEDLIGAPMEPADDDPGGIPIIGPGLDMWNQAIEKVIYTPVQKVLCIFFSCGE